MAKYQHHEDASWDRGREGYLDLPQKPVYAAVPRSGHKSKGQGLIGISTEVRLGSLIAAGGMIWGAYTATVNFAGVWSLDMIRHEALEVCGLGIVIWVHAKWRSATRIS